jgi:nifR3 family TIM-barrel protein
MKLGSLDIDSPLVLAPMAAVTNAAYRAICREQGAGLVVTEMVSARGVIAGDERTWRFVDLQPDEAPVAVQLFGCEPDALAEAARRVVERGADAVDVNMGCPMKKVTRTGRGAALLREPSKIEAIMRAMSDAVDVPVTAKIRAGWETSNAVDVARAIEAGGGAGVAIHGRTRSDMYEHHVDLDVIAEVVDAVDITVIGNGDVRDVESAARMQSTGCQGLMVARGCLGNPWLFAELSAWLRGESVRVQRTGDRVLAMMQRHFDHYVAMFGPVKACLDFRKHALWYLRGTPGESVLRRRMRGLDSVEAVREALAAACAAFDDDEAAA